MESRVPVNGVNIHYVIEGRDDAPVVTFSHALGADLHVWDAQAAACAERYRVLRYDTRGHGESDAPRGPYTLEQLAEDVVGLLDALGIGRTHFVGLSMGGMIGQVLALEHPDRVLSLVLCDTTSGRGELDQATWDANWKQRIESVLNEGLGPQVEPTIERWLSPEWASAHPEAVEKIRRTLERTPVAGYVGCCQAISKLDLTERLAEISCPTLVIVGEDDPGTPVSAARTIHERIAGSRLCVVPKARHLANVEQADLVSREILSFLDSIESRS
ncbi:MAG: 3-oxoadipate enol-lactonase [Candidatus Dadabacteria bacterium]|nr:MAG: 3-oxoadipate enol-lactonase [Candidatus Dadabacteria bacterium]